MEYVNIYSISVVPELQYKTPETITKNARRYFFNTQSPDELEKMPINLGKSSDKDGVYCVNGNTRLETFKMKVQELGDKRFLKIPAILVKYNSVSDAYFDVLKLNDVREVTQKESDVRILNFLKFRPCGVSIEEYAKQLSIKLNDDTITKQSLIQMIKSNEIRNHASRLKFKNINIINETHSLSLYLIVKRFSLINGKSHKIDFDNVILNKIISKIDTTGNDKSSNWNPSKVEKYMETVFNYPEDLRDLIVTKFNPFTISVLINDNLIKRVKDDSDYKKLFIDVTKKYNGSIEYLNWIKKQLSMENDELSGLISDGKKIVINGVVVADWNDRPKQMGKMASGGLKKAIKMFSKSNLKDLTMSEKIRNLNETFVAVNELFESLGYGLRIDDCNFASILGTDIRMKVNIKKNDSDEWDSKEISIPFVG